MVKLKLEMIIEQELLEISDVEKRFYSNWRLFRL